MIDDTKATVELRRCGRCGGSMAGRNADAMYCSRRCQVAAYHAGKRSPRREPSPRGEPRVVRVTIWMTSAMAEMVEAQAAAAELRPAAWAREVLADVLDGRGS